MHRFALPVLLTLLTASGCSSSSSGTSPKSDAGNAGDVDSTTPSDGGETDSAPLGDASEGDTSTPDDAAIDSGDAGPFLCSGTPCSSGEYCQEYEGPDGGAEAGPNALCKPIPAACTSTPTCACLETATGCGLGCFASGGSLTLVCYP